MPQMRHMRHLCHVGEFAICSRGSMPACRVTDPNSLVCSIRAIYTTIFRFMEVFCDSPHDNFYIYGGIL
jgi:hypothetical protein